MALPKGIIGLNIGGSVFLTSANTLSSSGSNFLTTMIANDVSGKVPTTKDAEGNYFVDRNGRIFEIVLDYLRTGILTVPASMDRAPVLRELDFYLITVRPCVAQELRDLCAHPELSSALRSAVDKLWSAMHGMLRELAKLGQYEAVFGFYRDKKGVRVVPPRLRSYGITRTSEPIHLTHEESHALPDLNVPMLPPYLQSISGLQVFIDLSDNGPRLWLTWYDDSMLPQRFARVLANNSTAVRTAM